MIQPVRGRRFLAPHPLVTLSGFAIGIAVFAFGRATDFQPPYAYVAFTVVFAAAFSAISRRSARREALRREQKMERIRRTPVLGLDE